MPFVWPDLPALKAEQRKWLPNTEENHPKLAPTPVYTNHMCTRMPRRLFGPAAHRLVKTAKSNAKTSHLALHTQAPAKAPAKAPAMPPVMPQRRPGNATLHVFVRSILLCLAQSLACLY
ncbi:hypothetical protein CDD81_2354 [Ophiocordyceps australis]|uniref:Uncharacterized protein n=1 Tax=Ophiocordyceps australis TaxID=1399860 RepID=A0A2C5XRQ8_9HYPO|nr:hypothetical protein CDD81_2354 [Ophiocordyceps australis]